VVTCDTEVPTRRTRASRAAPPPRLLRRSADRGHARGGGPRRWGTATPGVRSSPCPLVRRLRIRCLGVDLRSVEGTGPDGRITREDVEKAAAGGGPVDRVRLSPTRLAIARNLTRSWQEIPHVTTYRGSRTPPACSPNARGSPPIGRCRSKPCSSTPDWCRCCVEFPEFNASLDGEHTCCADAITTSGSPSTPRMG
jgi:hypothetical protein